jgi:hypothetical protein
VASDKKQKIDELVAKAAESLDRSSYFESERMAVKALSMARHDGDFRSMAAILPLLKQIRQCRLKQAQTTASGGKSRIIMLRTPVTEDMKITRGCYIVSPPQVGADARRLRLAAFEAEVSIVVVCREPRTQSGLVPVVAISAGATVRVKIDPPDNDDKPEHEWLVGALNQLGEHAVVSLDATMPAVRRVDALLERLDAVPENEGLHDALAGASMEAASEPQSTKKSAAARKESARLEAERDGEDEEESDAPTTRSNKPQPRTAVE